MTRRHPLPYVLHHFAAYCCGLLVVALMLPATLAESMGGTDAECSEVVDAESALLRHAELSPTSRREARSVRGEPEAHLILPRSISAMARKHLGPKYTPSLASWLVCRMQC